MKQYKRQFEKAAFFLVNYPKNENIDPKLPFNGSS